MLSSTLIYVIIALALGVIFVRRRVSALSLMAAQSIVLGAGALSLAGSHSDAELVAGIVLVCKGIVLPALIYVLVRRTPETRAVATASGQLVRFGVAAAVAICAVWLTPHLGLHDVYAERAAVALILIGITIVVFRRPVMFHLLGLIVAENGVALLTVSVPGGGIAYVVEIGALFDLVAVVVVAATFAVEIYSALGTGDSDQLRGLHD